MLTCREFIDFIANYLANEIAHTDRAVFEYHLADCLDCQKYLHSYQTTIAMSRSVFPDLDGPVPNEVPEALVQAILATRQHT